MRGVPASVRTRLTSVCGRNIAAAALEARAEIGDLDRRAVRAVEAREEHGGVRHVFLLAALEAAELDGPETAAAFLCQRRR